MKQSRSTSLDLFCTVRIGKFILICRYLICSCHSFRRKEAADPCYEKSSITCTRSLCCRCRLCTFGIVQRWAKTWESASGQGVPCKLRKNCWHSGASNWLPRRNASSEVSVTTAVSLLSEVHCRADNNFAPFGVSNHVICTGLCLASYILTYIVVWTYVDALNLCLKQVLDGLQQMGAFC